MSIWRGLIGAITGAIRGALERGYRFVTEGLRLGRPAPTPEIAEEVRAVRDVIMTLPPEMQEEALRLAGRAEAQYLMREVWGPRPYGMIADPELLPIAHIRWVGYRAGVTFRFEYTHPILGERVERHISVRFSEPTRMESLLQEAIKILISTDMLGLEPPDLEWELDSISRSREE